jgi:putative transferase (TIGR04331 family)
MNVRCVEQAGAAVKRYLVTTALEESWPADVPLLMLGEWCRRFDRRQHWAARDVVLASPVGSDPDVRARDEITVRSLAEELLPEISAALNTFHGVAHGVRYWRIVLGHWLIRYTSVVFNRVAAISAALRRDDIDRTVVLNAPAYTLSTTDSDAFVWACNDDLWNHVFYARILRHLDDRLNRINVETTRWSRSGETGFVRAGGGLTAVRGAKARATDAIAASLRSLARPTDALLLSTYLPPRQRMLLEIRLGQVPQLWRVPPVPRALPQREVRAALPASPAPASDTVTSILRVMWREVIPACFVETHAAIVTDAQHAGWPARPRFVFTSNAFDTDERFKVWVAQKVEQGTPYFTGQHGNNYGTHRWWGAEFWPERAATDRFVTWGWTNEDPREVPAFNFKTAGIAPRARVPAGGVLLIEVAIPHRTAPYDSDDDFAEYQRQQFRFVGALPDAIRARLTVRLHGEFRQHRWHEDQRWAESAPDVRLETGRAPIAELIAESQLVVHSYDSTGILETLALDIPTMCFWHGGLSHLNSYSRPYYELLRQAGILLETPEAAAAAVAKHFGDLSGWWRSDAVDCARREFCARYARTDPTPVATLRRILTRAVR